MQPYLDLVADITADTELEDLRYFTDCSCHLFKIRHGWAPDHFTNWRTAVEKWVYHCVFGTLYWGVHYRGKHILNVRNRYGLTWCGPVTFTPRTVKS